MPLDQTDYEMFQVNLNGISESVESIDDYMRQNGVEFSCQMDGICESLARIALALEKLAGIDPPGVKS